jgi:hypothetical protein
MWAPIPLGNCLAAGHIARHYSTYRPRNCGPPDGRSKLRRELVDLVGIEPTTSSMPWKRAPSCATGPRLKTKKPTAR